MGWTYRVIEHRLSERRLGLEHRIGERGSGELPRGAENRREGDRRAQGDRRVARKR